MSLSWAFPLPATAVIKLDNGRYATYCCYTLNLINQQETDVNTRHIPIAIYFVVLSNLLLGSMALGVAQADQASQPVVALESAIPSPKPGNCSASSPDKKHTCQTNCKVGEVASCRDGDPPECVCIN